MASTTGIEMFEEAAEDFMLRIFSLEAGDYLITDKSSLRDFKGVDGMTVTDIHQKIRDEFGQDVSDLESGNLLEIFINLGIPGL